MLEGVWFEGVLSEVRGSTPPRGGLYIQLGQLSVYIRCRCSDNYDHAQYIRQIMTAADKARSLSPYKATHWTKVQLHCLTEWSVSQGPLY